MFNKRFLPIVASVSAAAAAANFDAGANTNMAVYWVRGMSTCLTPILTRVARVKELANNDWHISAPTQVSTSFPLLF